MNKIIVLQGPPASGKSTWAKEFVQGKVDWVIVNRDSIRESTGEYWVPSREDYISLVENNAVSAAIKSHLNVVIDATNLNPKTITKWQMLSQELDAEIEFKMFTLPFAEALKRDTERGQNGGRAVGKKVLEQFYRNYFPEDLKEYFTDDRLKIPFYSQQPNRINAILVDLDGTVCLHNGRNAYDLANVSKDLPNTPLINLLINLNHTYHLIFLSGREGTTQCYNNSEAWLKKYFYDNNIAQNSLCGWHLLMRKPKDFRPDEVIKEEIFHKDIEPKYNVVSVFDDRDKVVKMWRNLGLLCNQVYYGNF